ncbi:MAG: DJ-1 family protein [Tenericutes bacterium HGW-Tenericutes-3]|nr:MAG: DJ-1 family protein [Tenericutes bacterium HGW-Tenericutes-3]
MKGLLVLSNQVEDGEALTTRALLIRAGLEVVTITFERSLEIKTAFGLQIKADHFAKDLNLSDYDFVVIPGGAYVAKVVDQDVNIKALVKQFNSQDKMVAAICAGPRFLGQAGLLDGRSFTAYRGTETDMPKGIYLPSYKAIRDHNIVTARGAGAVYEFSYEIVKYLLGEEKAQNLLNSILF